MKKLKKWAKNSDFPSKLNIGAAFGCSSLPQNRWKNMPALALHKLLNFLEVLLKYCGQTMLHVMVKSWYVQVKNLYFTQGARCRQWPLPPCCKHPSDWHRVQTPYRRWILSEGSHGWSWAGPTGRLKTHNLSQIRPLVQKLWLLIWWAHSRRDILVALFVSRHTQVT